MSSLSEGTKFKQWELLLAQQHEGKLIKLLIDAPFIEVADFLAKQLPDQLLALLVLLPPDQQGSVFAHFSTELQLELYHQLDKWTFSRIFSYMPSDQRADFYRQLSDQEHTRLLPYLSKRVKEDVITLSAYLPETAGGIMSTDFATVRSDMTIKQAIAKLREDSPSKKMIYYIYVVDANIQMVGIISLKDLVLAAPDEIVANILKEDFVYADVYEDQESVAKKIEKYDLVAIPILNEERQLAGIVSANDAMSIIRVEETEDMEKFMGIVSDEEPSDYLKSSSWQHAKKRVAWIMSLFVVSFLSGFILHRCYHLLEQFTILALYLPTLTDTGGNVGSQAATVVIRALSLGQITLRDWLVIILKETKVALILASCLFFLAFIKVVLLSEKAMLGHHSIYNLAFCIALSLSMQVVLSTIIGATLPLVAKYFKGDPAVAASPAITTIVDITGLLVYFSITYFFFCKEG